MSIKSTLQKYLDMNLENLEIADLTSQDMIVIATLRKMSKRGSMNDLFTLGKFLGEVEDTKTVVYKPIDQVLEGLEQNDEN